MDADALQWWQHDARLYKHSNGHAELTMFANNEASDISTGPASVALSLSLSLPPKRHTPLVLLKNLSDPVNPVTSRAGGSNMILPNGNHFVGYGKRPIIKEFGPEPRDGSDVRWSAQFAYLVESYRAYKQEWHATPSTSLDLVIYKAAPNDELSGCAKGSRSRGYVSWNGATDVIQYAIYVDFGGGELVRITTVPRKGFETEFVVPDSATRVQIAALECPDSHEVGKSHIVSVVEKA